MNSEQITSHESVGGRRTRLVKDFKDVVTDVDTLLRDVAGSTADELTAARSRIGTSLSTAKSKLDDARTVVKERAKGAVGATDQYVRQRPWGAIGMAAAAGLITGMLVRRR
jgi:ElaB/YqjD/DUF883 family membrane-anchored ribosome-binding protein